MLTVRCHPLDHELITNTSVNLGTIKTMTFQGWPKQLSAEELDRNKVAARPHWPHLDENTALKEYMRITEDKSTVWTDESGARYAWGTGKLPLEESPYTFHDVVYLLIS
jgi:hypothetical protein